MESEFWLQRWQDTQIGFHQAEPEQLLQQHWPTLGLPKGSSVFVPLCGKSLDMVWLAEQGHKIIGIELSQIAINDFFAGLDLTPEVRTESGFTIKSTGPYELWCGDFFALPDAALAGIAAIYDRAALIALPPEMRKRYARKLIDMNKSAAKTLLITLEYDQSILHGPPHDVRSDEVQALYASAWQIAEVSRGQAKALSPKFKAHGIETVGQAVYVMTPNQASMT